MKYGGVMDAKDLQRRWKEVVKTCKAEGEDALKADRPRWEAAQQAAEAVVAALEPVLKIELHACRAWQEARQPGGKLVPESKNRVRPTLRIVR
jgi:hypothetical protein